MDMRTLLPLPFKMLFKKYSYYVSLQYFYMSQIIDCTFDQTFYFVHYIFDIQVFKNRSRRDNNYECTIFTDMQHLYPHMTLYGVVIFFSWDGMMFCNVESRMIIFLSLSLDSFIPPSYVGLNKLL